MLKYQYAFNRQYDWVSQHGSRTPEEYPYNHDELYLWRDFKKSAASDIDAYYTDRMRQWDGDKYSAAVKAAGGFRNWGSVPQDRKSADIFVKRYFGTKYECCGVAQSINVSNGYPLGIIYVRAQEDAK